MLSLFWFAVAWILSLLLWLFFVFQVAWAEVIVGAVASALTVTAGYVILRIVPACFQPRLRWLSQVWRLPAMIVSDLWPLLRHLLREMTRKPSHSFFQMTNFNANTEDCQAAAQRALAILFVSTAPNSVVLDIDCEKGRMFFHQLEPAPTPDILRKLQE